MWAPQTNTVRLLIQLALEATQDVPDLLHHLEYPLASPFLVPVKASPSFELRGGSRSCPGTQGLRITKAAGPGLFLTSVPRARHGPGTEQPLNKSWLLSARGENGKAFLECNLAGLIQV